MNPLVQAIHQGIWPAAIVLGTFMCMLPWIKSSDRLRWLPVVIVLGLTVRYVIWRITDTLPPADETADLALGIVFLFIEVLAVLGSLLTLITLMRVRERTSEVDDKLANRPLERADPLIDVLICTYNEDEAILERTIAGALAMDYSRHRVWVLDDGRRDWLLALCEQLGCHYLARSENSHAKAGNINNALRHLSQLETPPDFVSVLDADFVPTSSFLTRTVALFDKDDVGVVQTPQHFVNPDPIQANLGASDIWPDEQRFFFDVLMPSKDAWGTAFCCGTSSLIRFAALQKAGGFPTTSITEDYLLTLRLKQFGFRTVYLNERLSMGLAPEGLGEYITQRSRWCLGFIQILRSSDGPFYPNKLAWVDRFSLIESFLYWSGTYLFRLASLLLPISYFLFGIRALDVELGSGLSHFLPYFVGHVVVIGWLSKGRIMPILTDVSQLLAMREIIRSVFVGLIKPKGHKFKVTAKGGDRSKTVVQWNMIAFFGMILSATLLSLLISFHLDVNRTLEDSSIVALFWSWYNILLLLIAMLCCIERPRMRRAERFEASETVEFELGGRFVALKMLDVSIYGMRIAGKVEKPVGSEIKVRFRSVILSGKVARIGPNDVAILIEHSVRTRIFMIGEVYSGRFGSLFKGVKATALGRRVIGQLLK